MASAADGGGALAYKVRRQIQHEHDDSPLVIKKVRNQRGGGHTNWVFKPGTSHEQKQQHVKAQIISHLPPETLATIQARLDKKAQLHGCGDTKADLPIDIRQYQREFAAKRPPKTVHGARVPPKLRVAKQPLFSPSVSSRPSFQSTQSVTEQNHKNTNAHSVKSEGSNADVWQRLRVNFAVKTSSSDVLQAAQAYRDSRSVQFPQALQGSPLQLDELDLPMDNCNVDFMVESREVTFSEKGCEPPKHQLSDAEQKCNEPFLAAGDVQWAETTARSSPYRGLKIENYEAGELGVRSSFMQTLILSATYIQSVAAKFRRKKPSPETSSEPGQVMGSQANTCSQDGDSRRKHLPLSAEHKQEVVRKSQAVDMKESAFQLESVEEWKCRREKHNEADKNGMDKQTQMEQAFVELEDELEQQKKLCKEIQDKLEQRLAMEAALRATPKPEIVPEICKQRVRPLKTKKPGLPLFFNRDSDEVLPGTDANEDLLEQRWLERHTEALTYQLYLDETLDVQTLGQTGKSNVENMLHLATEPLLRQERELWAARQHGNLRSLGPPPWELWAVKEKPSYPTTIAADNRISKKERAAIRRKKMSETDADDRYESRIESINSIVQTDLSHRADLSFSNYVHPSENNFSRSHVCVQCGAATILAEVCERLPTSCFGTNLQPQSPPTTNNCATCSRPYWGREDAPRAKDVAPWDDAPWGSRPYRAAAPSIWRQDEAPQPNYDAPWDPAPLDDQPNNKLDLEVVQVQSEFFFDARPVVPVNTRRAAESRQEERQRETRRDAASFNARSLGF